MSIKKMMKQLLAKMGYIIMRIDRNDTVTIGFEKWLWLERFDIHTLFDVGANKGFFTESIKNRIRDISVYAFEPLSDCYELLKDKYDDDTSIALINVALSDSEGESDFFISAHRASSSLLEMEESHKKLFPHTAECKRKQVRVRTLDSYMDTITIRGNLLIKLDVQGAEHNVINGGKFYFDKAAVVVVEMSHFPLYKDQALFDDVHKLLHQHGLRYSGTLSQCLRAKDNLPIFSNALYVRDNLLNSNDD